MKYNIYFLYTAYYYIVNFGTSYTVAKSTKIEDLEPLIYGGEPIDISEVPYQVSLHEYGQYFCGGSILNFNYILTAAHCVTYAIPGKLTVRAGSTLHSEGGVVAAVEDVFIHELYDGHNFDVAILKLVEPLRGNLIRPIMLPKKDFEVQVGSYVYVSGWGVTVSSIFEGCYKFYLSYI